MLNTEKDNFNFLVKKAKKAEFLKKIEKNKILKINLELAQLIKKRNFKQLNNILSKSDSNFNIYKQKHDFLIKENQKLEKFLFDITEKDPQTLLIMYRSQNNPFFEHDLLNFNIHLYQKNLDNIRRNESLLFQSETFQTYHIIENYGNLENNTVFLPGSADMNYKIGKNSYTKNVVTQRCPSF